MRKQMFGLMLAGILGMGLLAGGCGAGSNYSEEAKSSDMNGSYGGSSAQPGEIMEDADSAGQGAAGDAAEDESADAGADAVLDGDEAAGEQNKKLIYTYRYSVETKEFDTFTEEIRAEVDKLAGYVESSETDGNAADGMNRYASMTLRVPADNMKQLLAVVEEKSNVTYSTESSDDVTLRYVDMESHIKALRTEQKTLMRLIEQADKVEDVIALQSQLTQVRYEIESYESQLRTMDNLVEYSTLHLDISEVDRTTTVMTKASFWEEVRNRFSDNLYVVGQWLRGFAVWLISSLPILVPLFILAGAAVFVIRRWTKRRRNQRMQKTSVPGRYQSIYQRESRAGTTEVQAEESTAQGTENKGDDSVS